MSTINLSLINHTVICCSKRNSGKSVMIKHLVELEKDKFDKIFVLCPSESVNRFYRDIVDEKCIFDSYNEIWMEKLIEKLTTVNKDTPKEELKKVLLIFDDILSDIDFHQSPAIRKIFARGRHVGLSIILSAQYIYMISPLARVNTDFILVGAMNHQSKNLLCDEFLSGNLDRKQFLNLYNKATKDYNFLLINNNNVKDNDDIDQIYGTIKAPF